MKKSNQSQSDTKPFSPSSLSAAPVTSTFGPIEMLCNNIMGGTDEKSIIVIIKVLQDTKVNVNTRDSRTRATPLALAITMLLPEVVDALLVAGADVTLAAGLKGKENCLPLPLALRKASPSDAKTLYLNSPKAPLTTRPKQTTATYQAARQQIIVALLKQPTINLTQKDGDGLDTFAWLKKLNCAEKDKDVYQLFKAGAPTQVNFFELIKKPSIESAESDYKQLVKHIETNPDFLQSIDPITRHTPLGLAIKFLRPDYVALFLESKANPNQPTGKDKYNLPITIALSKNHVTVTSAQPSSVFRCPRLTLLGGKDCGCPTDRDKIIQLLLDNPRLDINLLEKDGKTPLDCLAGWGGASKDLKNFLLLSAKGAKFAEQLTTPSAETPTKS